MVNRIGDLERRNNTLEENLHHVYEKFNWMYEHVNTFTANDWKTGGKWAEYKLMTESMHHVKSQMKDDKEKQIIDTSDRKREA